MAFDDDLLDTERDALYGLPLDAFVPARDEAARRLRSDGDREAATAVKQLRKPSVAAWALNQVRRRAPRRIDALLEAADTLREAHEALLGGGGQGALREAAAAQRALVQEVVELAEHELEEGGHPASAAVQTKLFETLQAATRDPAVRQLLAAGTLVREAEVGDLGFGDATAFTAPAPVPKRAAERKRAAEPRRAADRKRAPATPRRAAPKATPAEQTRPDPALDRRRDKAADRLHDARTREDELRDRLRDAEQEAGRARRAAQQAARDAERAATRVDRARADFEVATERSAELAAQLDKLEQAAGGG